MNTDLQSILCRNVKGPLKTESYRKCKTETHKNDMFRVANVGLMLYVIINAFNYIKQVLSSLNSLIRDFFLMRRINDIRKKNANEENMCRRDMAKCTNAKRQR